MTPLVYPLNSDLSADMGIVPVPCFHAVSYDGNTAVLQADETTVPFDVSALTSEELEDANRGHGRDVRVRGLVALPTRWMQELPDVTFRPPYRKPLGVRVGGHWYYAWPLRWGSERDLGADTVVRLSS